MAAMNFDTSPDSSSEISRLKARVNALESTVAQHEISRKVKDKELEFMLNQLRGSQTRFQDYVFKKNAEFSASTISQDVPKISKNVSKLEQKLDMLPAVKSQVNNIDSKVDRIESSLDDVKSGLVALLQDRLNELRIDNAELED